MHTDIKKVLVSHQQIVERAQELANEIQEDYKDKKPTYFGCVIKRVGSVFS